MSEETVNDSSKPVAPDGAQYDNHVESPVLGEPGQGVITPPIDNPFIEATPEQVAAMAAEDEASVARAAAIVSEVDEAAGILRRALEATPEDCFMLAMRCPCGFIFTIAIPKQIFHELTPMRLAAEAAKNFVAPAFDHLETLGERLSRYDSDPPQTWKKGRPKREDIVASYHGHPCELRVRPVAAEIVEPVAQEPVAPPVETPKEG